MARQQGFVNHEVFMALEHLLQIQQTSGLVADAIDRSRGATVSGTTRILFDYAKNMLVNVAAVEDLFTSGRLQHYENQKTVVAVQHLRDLACRLQLHPDQFSPTEATTLMWTATQAYTQYLKFVLTLGPGILRNLKDVMKQPCVATFFYFDIVESRGLPPDLVGAALDEAKRRVADHEGTLVGAEGDSLLIGFIGNGSEERAVRAGVAFLHCLEIISCDHVPPHRRAGVHARVRAVITTGRVDKDQGGEVSGDPLVRLKDLLARRELSRPNCIIVDQQTLEAVRTARSTFLSLFSRWWRGDTGSLHGCEFWISRSVGWCVPESVHRWENQHWAFKTRHWTRYYARPGDACTIQTDGVTMPGVVVDLGMGGVAVHVTGQEHDKLVPNSSVTVKFHSGLTSPAKVRQVAAIGSVDKPKPGKAVHLKFEPKALNPHHLKTALG